MTLHINELIDHTNLKPEATREDVKQLCAEAAKWKFKAVCVNPAFVKMAAEELASTTVGVCTVIGFPLGATTTAVKVFEAEEAIKNGANEIDMVINIGALKSKDYQYVLNDIKQVVHAADGALTKVILETCLLTEQEKRIACQLSLEAGAHFVKTSTGFSTGGATSNDVALMKSVVKDKIGIKASGGIRDKETLLAMVAAGATRIGTSSGVRIMQG